MSTSNVPSNCFLSSNQDTSFKHMPKTLAAESPLNTLNPALLAFKPRQVLISRSNMGKELAVEKESKTVNLKADQKAVLLKTIAQYLERCGFSKCFKKLLSEAEIEKKDLDNTLPNLEEIYYGFLKKSQQEAEATKDESGEAEEANDKKEEAETIDEKHQENAETDKKKKKKKEGALNGISEETVVEDAKKVKKEKRKKKKEAKSEVTEEKVEDGSSADKKETNVEMKDSSKDKKKKNKSKSSEAESLNDDKEKASKKRKRSEPEVTEERTEDVKEDEESKRRKKEVNTDDNDVQETPVKQTETQENGNAEKSETKLTNQKSGKGMSNSKEPKKPFQRVNVEEVVFNDDRLKDNSYWAKDGADIGYGAKAQEVLGQVRGRDFRHEKTKKKRGSYRGGEIDLQSHSVKFDYSDEE